ncbi:MAG: PEGA domain-containing protein [Polyangiaceae bacterium]
MLLLTGTAKIEFDERGAEVFVDGKSVGKTPMIPPIILNPGTHDFWILKEGFETVEKRGVTIKSQEVTNVSLKFIPDKNDKSANSLGGTKPSAKRGNDDEDDDTPRKKKKRRRDRDDEDEEDSREDSTPAATTGAYVDVTGFGSFVLSKYPLLPCPDPPYASCTSSRAFGGGAVLRGGYRFGVLSLEAVGAFLADRHEEKHAIQGTLNPADAEFAEGLLSRYEGYSLYSLGGFVGAGGRLTSSGNFRLTFGLSPGITFRNFSLVRYTSGGVTDEYGADASYAAFAGLVDAGMIIGISKSAAIGVGVLFWVDAPRGDAVTPSGDPRPVSVKTTEGNVDATIPTPRYVLASGLQMFVGLGISAHFGP